MVLATEALYLLSQISILKTLDACKRRGFYLLCSLLFYFTLCKPLLIKDLWKKPLLPYSYFHSITSIKYHYTISTV